MTFKTVTVYKKPYFFSLKALKQEKEGGTNFVLLCQLRIMVGQFKKTYLHRAMEILHFLVLARIQKCLT